MPSAGGLKRFLRRMHEKSTDKSVERLRMNAIRHNKNQGQTLIGEDNKYLDPKGRRTNRALESMHNHPYLTALGVGGTAAFLGKDVIAPPISNLLNADEKHASLLASEVRRRHYESQRMSRLEEFMKLQEDTARIMELRPDLAQRLLAGRMLPRGGVVFGGQPRSDLLEAVTAEMAMESIRAREAG